MTVEQMKNNNDERLEKENATLRADNERLKISVLEIENARLKECAANEHARLNTIITEVLNENVRLREVVEAAQKYVNEKLVDEDYVEDRERFEELEAALAKVEEPK